MNLSPKGTRDVAWPSMTAPMDRQSAVDTVPWGRWRHVENFRALQAGRLGRADGWRRFGYWTNHPNCDLNDQHGEDSVISSLHVYRPNTRRSVGVRLFAGAGRDVWMNRMDGGWNHVGIGASGGGRWSFGSTGRVIVAGNGKSVLWQRVGLDSLGEITSLTDIGVTGASVVFEYQGCIFVANVVMDGRRVANRVLWANPDSVDFSQGLDSIAGFRDLNSGEEILGAVACGSIHLILTTHGAWRLGVADSGEFSFQQLYYHEKQDACLVSETAFACNREICYFMAKDGIYAITPYSAAPEWVEWVNKGLPESFLGGGSCKVSASEYDPERHELLFSSSELGQTFVVNTRETSTSVRDKGFTALCSGTLDRSDDHAMWMTRSGICNAGQVNAAFPLGPRDDARILPASESVAGTCDFFNPPCEAQCSNDGVTIGVASDDNTLKIFDSTFLGRERRTETGWVVDGYASRFVTAPCNFGLSKAKTVTSLLLDFLARSTDTPAKIILKVGTSATPVDPLALGDVSYRLITMSVRDLKGAVVQPNIQPSAKPVRWTFELDGRFVWFDITIPSMVGGPVEFSRMVAGVAQSRNAVE